MTNISVFGEQNEQKKEKAIELCYWVSCGTDFRAKTARNVANNWDNICLLGKALDDPNFDLIMAWDDGNTSRAIYLGHWNDGIV